MRFMRFLGLSLGDRVLDAKTIWLFRENLTKASIIDWLFINYCKELEKNGIITHPEPSLTRHLLTPLSREIPVMEARPSNPVTCRRNGQKTRRSQSISWHRRIWASAGRKNNETHYGYKNRAKVDADSKIIIDYAVTDASVHDSQRFSEFFTEKDKVAYAGGSYVG